ncbi:MAG: serine hydrolase domain-containing protein [Propionibacteriaceae bacterium]
MTATTPLPRSTPSTQGIEPTGLLGLVDGLEGAGIEMHSLVVLRHGHVVAEGWWNPYRATDIALLHSLSKSFASTAAGLAVHDGLLDTDDRVLEHFAEVTGEVHPRLAELRVHHLLSMSTGHLADTLPTIVAAHLGSPDSRDFASVDLVRGFFALPPEQEPGSLFAYNNTATYLLARIVQRVTGQTLVDYLTPRLFAPLGITDLHWAEDGQGHNLGFSGLHLGTESIARFGQLYLQRGAWQGEQLVPVDWVDRATRVQTPTHDNDATVDWRQGYGYQFWMARHGYRGDGAFGQFCLVLPEQDLVVAITSATERMQDVLDQVWRHLLPACGAEVLTGQAEDEDRLAARLSALELPGPDGPALDVDRDTWSTDTYRWEPAEPAPAAPATELQLGPAGPLLQSVEVRGPADARHLVLVVDGREYVLELHPKEWRRGVLSFDDRELVVATRGGPFGAGDLLAEVVFVNKPHLLRVHGRDGRFRAEYNIPPLGSPRLADLALHRLP